MDSTSDNNVLTMQNIYNILKEIGITTNLHEQKKSNYVIHTNYRKNKPKITIKLPYTHKQYWIYAISKKLVDKEDPTHPFKEATLEYTSLKPVNIDSIITHIDKYQEQGIIITITDRKLIEITSTVNNIKKLLYINKQIDEIYENCIISN